MTCIITYELENGATLDCPLPVKITIHIDCPEHGVEQIHACAMHMQEVLDQ